MTVDRLTQLAETTNDGPAQRGRSAAARSSSRPLDLAPGIAQDADLAAAFDLATPIRRNGPIAEGGQRLCDRDGCREAALA